jgi:hypothetical protein
MNLISPSQIISPFHSNNCLVLSILFSKPKISLVLNALKIRVLKANEATCTKFYMVKYLAIGSSKPG